MKFYDNIKIFNNTERKFGTMIIIIKKSEKSYFFATEMKTTMRYDCQYDNKVGIKLFSYGVSTYITYYYTQYLLQLIKCKVIIVFNAHIT